MKILLYSLLANFLFITLSWAVQPGDNAPICSTTDFSTQQAINIHDFKGKVVYLDFWASWCPSCKLSFPVLNELHNELKQDGFEVLAINLDETKEEAREFLRAEPVDFKIASNEKNDCPEAYEVMAMPSSYIIDKQGKIREIHLGFKENDITEIRKIVLSLLAE